MSFIKEYSNPQTTAPSLWEDEDDRVFAPSPMPARNHHNWGSRFGRMRQEKTPTPNNLLELEEQAQRTVALMEKHGAKSDNNYHKAMDLLRLQYNMNFVIICEQCNGHHKTDELLAPER